MFLSGILLECCESVIEYFWPYQIWFLAWFITWPLPVRVPFYEMWCERPPSYLRNNASIVIVDATAISTFSWARSAVILEDTSTSNGNFATPVINPATGGLVEAECRLYGCAHVLLWESVRVDIGKCEGLHKRSANYPARRNIRELHRRKVKWHWNTSCGSPNHDLCLAYALPRWCGSHAHDTINRGYPVNFCYISGTPH